MIDIRHTGSFAPTLSNMRIIFLPNSRVGYNFSLLKRDAIGIAVTLHGCIYVPIFIIFWERFAVRRIKSTINWTDTLTKL